MYRHIIICFSLVLIGGSVFAHERKQINPRILADIEAVLDKIYALSTQEFIDLVKDDIDCCLQLITGPQLRERMQHEPNLLVINVLSERWFNDCHIKGSINIPLKDLLYRVEGIPFDQPIVVYCALDACNGGQKAALLLRFLGYTNVVDYPGGIKDWFQHGYPIQGPCAEKYLHEAYTHRGICIDENAL